jgi:hypothetical protein
MRLTLLMLAVLLSSPVVVRGQLRASERATLSQTVDGTRVTVDYSRPRMRGRTGIFGSPMVHWNEVWTPGADDATTLELSKDVSLLGRPVPKKRYSVWLVVREHSDWTLVLDPRDSLFHTDHPDSTAAQIRIPVAPELTPPTEVLTWSVPVVTNRGMTLVMQWADRTVRLPIEVQQAFPHTVSAAEAAPFVGVYDFRWTDTTSAEPPSTFTVVLRDGALMGEWSPPQFKTLKGWQLIASGTSGRFHQGFLLRGELAAVYEESMIEFSRTGGRVTGFEVRFGAGEVTARGVRRR